MTYRLGTDLIYLPRLQAACDRHGLAFFERLLTPAERAYCLAGQAEDACILLPRTVLARLGARVAAKEAVSKALGTGMSGLGWDQGPRWHDIEVISAPQAAPVLALHGQARQLADALGITGWEVSLTHDGDYAMAVVIGF